MRKTVEQMSIAEIFEAAWTIRALRRHSEHMTRSHARGGTEDSEKAWLLANERAILARARMVPEVIKPQDPEVWWRPQEGKCWWTPQVSSALLKPLPRSA